MTAILPGVPTYNMEIKYLALIVISSALHAFYNFLMRKNGGDHYFLNGILLAAGLLSVIAMTLLKGYAEIPWNNVPYIYGASFFYILYQIFVNKAYQQGGAISTSYPLTVLSPLFIPIWAFIVLGEKISMLTGVGIGATVLGAMMVQMKEISLTELKKMFQFNKDYKGARYAILSSFVYSFGAIFDKYRVSSFQASAYLGLLVGFMSLNMIIYMLISGRADFMGYTSKNWKILLIGGIALLFSFLFFRLALQKIDVSIAVPMRQTAIIFAIIFGVVFLKEKFKMEKVVAVIVIFVGILLINIGM